MPRPSLAVLSLCLVFAGPALAQADMSKKTAVQRAEELVGKQVAPSGDARFQNLKTFSGPKGDTVCGEISSPATHGETWKFGIKPQQEPVVFETTPIPAKIPFRDVNEWVNRSVALDEIELMGCVPKGTYQTYNDKLTHVFNAR